MSAPPGKGFRLGNRPELTGIRAPLLATVVIFHSEFSVFPGAWASLGVFFVLSGFLITTMLATEQRRAGTISLKHFYTRRAVRLLPPLFITVALLAIYSVVVHVNDAAQKLWGDVAAAVFYFADYRSAFGHEPGAGGFLAQCWSLAVEEQFYLVWAVLLFVALHYGNRKLAYGLAIGGIVASVADRTWIVLHAHQWNSYVSGRVYYGFDTRADALFLGCLLGLAATGGHLEGWKPRSKQVLSVLAVLSVAVMIWILFSVSLSARSLPLVWLPVSEVASVVIITFLLLNRKGISARILGVPILVLLGNMSYSIYLFHWPVFVAISPFTVRWSFWAYETLRLAIILALALATWFLVEKPLMEWRRRSAVADGAADPEMAVAATRGAAAPPGQRRPAVRRPIRRVSAPYPRPLMRRKRWVLATELLAPPRTTATMPGGVARSVPSAEPPPPTPGRDRRYASVAPVRATDLLATKGVNGAQVERVAGADVLVGSRS